jgi:membrane-bound lytic murein transglycosylase D
MNRRIARLIALSIPLILITAATQVTADVAESPADHLNALLPAPAGLHHQVEFWKNVFATYSRRQVVLHDALHLNRIYEVLDFRPLAETGLSDAEIAAYAADKVHSEKERVRAILMRLHQLGPDIAGLSDEERKIWALFATVKNPDKYLLAAAEDRIRAQSGLRERFEEGLEISRRYLPEMERIFRREGLPVELTRLPLVESCFNVHAYSKVGAAGIWQFMPSTGRIFMRVDNAVDERRDPIVSTTAAAQYLKANYAVLGSWPLAITAYNHGRAGMMHAVETVGSSDIMQIIRHYHGPAFKFASRNFYAEFLAAVEVERNADRHFPYLNPSRPLRTDVVTVPDYVGFKTLAHVINADEYTLADLNPALGREVIAGKLHVPRGYRLRIPPGSARGFAVRYAALSAGDKHTRQKTQIVRHTVKRAQTVAMIAKRHRSAPAATRRSNKRNAPRLRAVRAS